QSRHWWNRFALALPVPATVSASVVALRRNAGTHQRNKENRCGWKSRKPAKLRKPATTMATRLAHIGEVPQPEIAFHCKTTRSKCKTATSKKMMLDTRA